METATRLSQIFSALAATAKAAAEYRPEKCEVREHSEATEFLMRLV
ncbi:MAG: hypothetical protein KME26_30325 [Oscillatoria princeps RMCB-10]|jgi:hypothetical protein|nr:hypothetical protein [Oscillatoria princeps RMCB-10]